MDKKKFTEALNKAMQDKGKRKFKQSVELIINMRGVDFSKSENRLNLDILLPKGKGGKELKCAVFAENELGDQAKKAGADLIISPDNIPNWKDKVKELADNYFLLSQPNLMAVVAKNLGQYLGKRGKLPKPAIGNIGQMIQVSKKSVRIVSKGKYLPVAHVFIGTEEMSVDDLCENAEAVFMIIKNKVKESGIKNIYIKLTMGKPIVV